MEFSPDMAESERKRYNAIKESGKYLEFNILIGTEKTKYDEHTGLMPVITTKMHGCGPRELAYLHASLKAMIEQLEHDYPVECLYSTVGMSCTQVDKIQAPIKED